MASLRTSQDATAKIKQARDEKGWNVDDQEPLKKASEVLTGETDWPKETPNGYLYADGVSEATWKRFLYGTDPINTKVYKVFCEILNLNWKELVDDSLRSRRPANHDREEKANDIEDRRRTRGEHIPGTRCRIVWGRDDLTARVTSCLADSQELPILSLSGFAGYGKTEAATKIARTALDKNIFSDVLWVKARDTDLGETRITGETQAEALNWDEFIYRLSCQLDCPPEQEQVQKYLREEKLLVVLDNAETADIENILSKLVYMLNPSRTLLTSRLKNNLQYVRLIECSGLEEKWSRSLLLDEAEHRNVPALLQASDEQLCRVHHLSCGAPLALHFVVGSVGDDESLDPVLSALEQADREVEVFYQFTLETAWQRITDTAKEFLRQMAKVDAGVTPAELCGVLNLSNSDARVTRNQLKRWSLILDEKDVKGNQRYDLHPWVRSAIRSGLIEKFKPPSFEELERWANWKYNL
jgi:hypothetical protein